VCFMCGVYACHSEERFDTLSRPWKIAITSKENENITVPPTAKSGIRFLSPVLRCLSIHWSSGMCPKRLDFGSLKVVGGGVFDLVLQLGHVLIVAAGSSQPLLLIGSGYKTDLGPSVHS